MTGATGKQGGAAARALLARGTPVRALVRDRTSEAARAVETLGADLVRGDLDDPAPLGAAVADVRAVFSVQTPDLADLASDAERVRGRKLVDAARDAGVPQFVHTSVSGAGDHHRAAAGWAQGRWNTDYWESKAATDESVRGAGFRHRTILRPATFTENFVRPSSYFVNWVEDRFLLAPAADTRLPLIAVRDIGAAVAAAVADPEKFHGRVVQLAGDHLTMTEIVRVLSDAWGTELALPTLTRAQALEQGLPGLPDGVMELLVDALEWTDEVGSPARPEHARALGLETTDLATWAATTPGRPSS